MKLEKLSLGQLLGNTAHGGNDNVLITDPGKWQATWKLGVGLEIRSDPKPIKKRERERTQGCALPLDVHRLLSDYLLRSNTRG